MPDYDADLNRQIMKHFAGDHCLLFGTCWFDCPLLRQEYESLYFYTISNANQALCFVENCAVFSQMLFYSS